MVGGCRGARPAEARLERLGGGCGELQVCGQGEMGDRVSIDLDLAGGSENFRAHLFRATFLVWRALARPS